jgi:lipopolysaccharide export system protein LptA
MTRTLFISLMAALALTGAGWGQAVPGQGPIDVSSDDFEIFDAENRAVYTGDVNVTRGNTRLRADRIDIFFVRNATGGFDSFERFEAVGDVFYVTPNEIARGDRGIYDLVNGRITLTGDVVLTQGCNVSTGEQLVADLDGGSARLTSGTGPTQNERVRSVFFDTPNGASAEPRDCPQPTIPGAGPRPFPEENG